MPGGRPSKFNDIYLGLAAKLAEDGKTNAEIANFMGVSERTFYRWLKNNDEFWQSIKDSKDVADDLVEASLFKKAVGFSVPEVKTHLNSKTGQVVEHEVIKHYAPDTTAMIFWLKNRRKDKWGESAEGDRPIQITLGYAPKSKRDDDSAGD